MTGDLTERLELEAMCEAAGRLGAPTAIAPGAAADWRRAATFVASPSATVCGLRRADQADPRPARVDPDADGEVRDAPGLGDVARVLADHLLDAQSRARSALGVVLADVRDAEVRADAVAGVRLDGAAVLLHGLAHLRHALADERLHLIRREPLAERRRADDVGEEHGDRAKLVLGCPLRRRRRARRRRRGDGERGGRRA